MDDPKAIASDSPWSIRASYYGQTGSLASMLRRWASDAQGAGIRGQIRLSVPLQLPSWSQSTVQPSVVQCLELVALLEAQDSGG